jgi:hypothetical protein
MLVVIALAGTALTACTPTPEPTPTPTAAFASEEEAFAAAEETFRNYTAALSAVDLTAPESLENIYMWLVADAENASRETFSQLAAEKLTVSGETTFTHFEGTEVDLTSGATHAIVCLNVSDVDVLTSQGDSVVADDRPDLQPLDVSFVAANTPSGLAISSNQPSDIGQCTI